jgi:O-antigen/teichoic acid export membrane protein
MTQPQSAVLAVAAAGSHTSRRLFGRDMGYVLLSSAQLLITALMSPVLAHLIAPGSFGVLATAIALYQFLVVISSLGLEQVVVIYNADPKYGPTAARRVITLACLYAAAVCAVVVATGPLWIRWLGLDHFSGPIAVAVLWCAPGAANIVALGYLRARDQLLPFGVISTITSIGGQLIGLALCLAFARSAVAYAWGGVITQFVALAITLVLVRPSVPRRRPAWVETLHAFRVGAPLAIVSVSMFALSAADRVLVQHYLGEVAVARYQVAYIVGSAIIILLGALSQTWLPRMLDVRDDEERTALIRWALLKLQGIVGPLIVAVACAAPILLSIVAPPSFHPTSLGYTVVLVALAGLPFADTCCTGLRLVATRHTRHLAATTVIAAVVNIALNVVLDPHLHLPGAALATLIAFLVQALLQRATLYRLERRRGWSWRYFAIIVLTGAAAFGITVAPTSDVWLVGRGLAAAVLVALAARQLISSWRGAELGPPGPPPASAVVLDPGDVEHS